MTDTTIATRFVDANGLRFEVTECGNGDRFALCLHGFPESAFSWRHQLPLLARLGYRVWAPNLRGYGRSSRPTRVEDYRIDRLVDDVAGLIDAASASETLLVGHDWGGGIAWMTALGQTRRLTGLIIMNVPHPVLFAAGLFKWPQIRRSWYIFAFQIPKLPELVLRRRRAQAVANAVLAMAADKTRFPAEVLDVYRRQALEPGALTAMINYYRANRGILRRSRAGARSNHLAQQIEVPTLLIWGEADTALGKELTYGTDRLVTDLSVRYLPDVSHWVQQEAPELVNEAIKDWLDHLPRQSAASE
ncbi:MAG: alpha/beta hydrolase [Vicinamibacterales bacterium]|nr:alpha/beta hydrolase [Vicinamibacterales bacterium]